MPIQQFLNFKLADGLFRLYTTEELLVRFSHLLDLQSNILIVFLSNSVILTHTRVLRPFFSSIFENGYKIGQLGSFKIMISLLHFRIWPAIQLYRHLKLLLTYPWRLRYLRLFIRQLSELIFEFNGLLLLRWCIILLWFLVDLIQHCLIQVFFILALDEIQVSLVDRCIEL